MFRGVFWGSSTYPYLQASGETARSCLKFGVLGWRGSAICPYCLWCWLSFFLQALLPATSGGEIYYDASTSQKIGCPWWLPSWRQDTCLIWFWSIWWPTSCKWSTHWWWTHNTVSCLRALVPWSPPSCLPSEAQPHSVSNETSFGTSWQMTTSTALWGDMTG